MTNMNTLRLRLSWFRLRVGRTLMTVKELLGLDSLLRVRRFKLRLRLRQGIVRGVWLRLGLLRVSGEVREHLRYIPSLSA